VSRLAGLAAAAYNRLARVVCPCDGQRQGAQSPGCPAGLGGIGPEGG
jgi:hypothetical protein